MAIAFDASSVGTSNFSAPASISWSHTCSGTNRILFVVACSSNPDVVSGVTYNGVAMTKIGASVQNTNADWVSLWYLIAPATGANNVVVTGNSTSGLFGVSSSYTGALQTGQPDASGGNATATSTTFSASATAVASNCWAILGVVTGNSSVSAGSGTTLRQNQSQPNSRASILDSNGVVATGSVTLNATSPGNTNWGGKIATFAPQLTLKTLTATQGQTPTITTNKITAKTLSASQGQTATIVTQRTKPRTLSASSAVVATIQRQIAKTLRAVQAQVAAVTTAIIWLNPAWTYISVNAVARAYGRSSATSKVFASSLRITDTVNETPTRANFVAAGWIPAVGNDVVIALGGISNPTRLFGGVVLNVRPSSVGTPSNAVFDVQATDYTWLMDQEPFFGFFQNQTVATIAAALIAAAPGFTVNVAADIASVVIDEISFTNQPITDCFTQLVVKRAGGYWFCDYFKVAQVYGSYAGRNPTPLDASYPLALGLQNFRCSSALDQVITRQCSEGGGGKARVSVGAGATTLPVDDATFYLDAGGMVTIKQQRGVTYTGRIVGGGGSLAGAGASPSSAPALALASGTGMGVGVYQYAYTDVTAAGESLPSPLGSVTTGVTAAPITAPTGGAPTSGGAIEPGSYDYEVTFVTGSGETTPGPISSAVPVAGLPSPVLWTGAAAGQVGVNLTPAAGAGLGVGVYTYAATWVTAAGETVASGTWTITTSAGNQRTSQYISTRYLSDDPAELSPPPASAVSMNLYRTVANGSQLKLLANFALHYINAGYVDSAADGSLGVNVPTTNTAIGLNASVPLTAIPIGAPAVTSRNVYRRLNAAGTFKLVTTIPNNTATTYTDTTGNAGLGAAAPSSNTTTAQRVAVSGIGIGASPTTSRKVYRTAVGGSQLKLLTTIANNTATTFADSTADGSLGANAPTGDTSALTQQAGQILPGATSLLVAGAGAFSSSGGWAVIGNGQQTISYTGITGNTLTGIPATGIGAVTAPVTYGSTVTVAPCLVGIPSTGPGSLAYPIVAGDDVNLLVQEDDIGAQATLAALLSVSLPGSTGVKSSYVKDGRISYTEARARAVARLAASRQVDTTVWYDCRDIDSQSGATISVNLLDAPGGPVVGDFTIQTVMISLFSATAGTVSPLYPTYSVEASTRRFSLEDLLRRALAAAA